MAIEMLQFMDKAGAKSFATQVLSKTNLRIEERIVTTVDANSTDKTTPSAKAVYDLIAALQAADTTLSGKVDTNTNDIAENAADIGLINEAQTEQDNKLTAVERGISDLDAAVEAFTHLTFQTVTGSIDTVTEPDPEVLYFQRDDESDTMWMLYVHSENGWVNIGDTAVDLSGYWTKDNTEELREVLDVHDAEPIPDDEIVSIIDGAFDNTFVEFVEYTDFTITRDNRHMIGYTDETTNLVIPSRFTADDGTNYKVVAIDDTAINFVPGTFESAPQAFSDCTNLQSVIIPNTVTLIGAEAFSGCTGLTSIDIPDSVTNIEMSAFYNCTALESVKFGNNVTKLGSNAFDGCASLSSVIIPDNITSIGGAVFANCTSLTEVTILNNDNITFGKNVFQNTPWLAAKQAENPLVIVGNGILIDGSAASGNVVIPDTVIRIDNAFNKNESITSVIIPDTVTSIGVEAFRNCTGLTSIDIPDSVTNIGNYAFANCTNLQSVIIPNSVTTVGHSILRTCTSLTSINIPDSVTNIDVYTFAGCTSLTEITIPNSVTNIGDNAFQNCNALKTVNYRGTEEQWKAITISNSNSYLTNADINYNYTGE